MTFWDTLYVYNEWLQPPANQIFSLANLSSINTEGHIGLYLTNQVVQVYVWRLYYCMVDYIQISFTVRVQGVKQICVIL